MSTQQPSQCVSPVRDWHREVPLAPVRIRAQCCHGWAQEGSAPVEGLRTGSGGPTGPELTVLSRSHPGPGWLYERSLMLSGVVRSWPPHAPALQPGPSSVLYVMLRRHLRRGDSAGGALCRFSNLRGGWRARVDGSSSEARGVLRHSTWSWALWVGRMEGCCQTTPACNHYSIITTAPCGAPPCSTWYLG